MDEYDFRKREDIDTWYGGMVEVAVKTPLRHHLEVNPQLDNTRLTFLYGAVLAGLGSVRNEFYSLAGIRERPANVRMDEILEEIRGTG